MNFDTGLFLLGLANSELGNDACPLGLTNLLRYTPVPESTFILRLANDTGRQICTTMDANTHVLLNPSLVIAAMTSDNGLPSSTYIPRIASLCSSKSSSVAFLFTILMVFGPIRFCGGMLRGEQRSLVQCVAMQCLERSGELEETKNIRKVSD